MAVFENMARLDGNIRQWGATGGPAFQTTVVTVQSGDEQRAQNWTSSRGAWNIGNRQVPLAAYQNLLDFFYQMKGKLKGFRVCDWTDFQDDGRGILGTGVGDPLNLGQVYQMNKRRLLPDTTDGFLQKITRPIGPSFIDVPELGDTIKVFVNGVQVGAVVDDTTGLVTLPAPTSGTDVLTWTGRYDIPARFDTDSFQMNQIEAFIEQDGDTPKTVWVQLGAIPVVQLRE